MAVLARNESSANVLKTFYSCNLQMFILLLESAEKLALGQTLLNLVHILFTNVCNKLERLTLAGTEKS